MQKFKHLIFPNEVEVNQQPEPTSFWFTTDVFLLLPVYILFLKLQDNMEKSYAWTVSVVGYFWNGNGEVRSGNSVFTYAKLTFMSYNLCWADSWRTDLINVYTRFLHCLLTTFSASLSFFILRPQYSTPRGILQIRFVFLNKLEFSIQMCIRDSLYVY